jgi:hypothetical protein
MFASVTAFCRANAAALHVRPSAVQCELQLSPSAVFAHFIKSRIVCAFAVGWNNRSNLVICWAAGTPVNLF